MFVTRGISSAGRARGSQSRGQGFDPPMLHHNKERTPDGVLFCYTIRRFRCIVLLNRLFGFVLSEYMDFVNIEKQTKKQT